jgi:hypothetical protein
MEKEEKKMNDAETIIQEIIKDKSLEKDAYTLRQRYNESYIRADDVLVYKRLASAYLRLVWALRKINESKDH